MLVTFLSSRDAYVSFNAGRVVAVTPSDTSGCCEVQVRVTDTTFRTFIVKGTVGRVTAEINTFISL